jgi:hypothetical protein
MVVVIATIGAVTWVVSVIVFAAVAVVFVVVLVDVIVAGR